MARWRGQALEYLPQLRKEIAAADSVMALWIEIRHAFERAYAAEPRDEAIIAGAYAYADWCVRAPRGTNAGNDPGTAVCVAFYEDIPSHPLARADMPRWFTHAEILGMRAIFAYGRSEAEVDSLLEFVRKNRRRYVMRKTNPPDTRRRGTT